jgi:hypothetical protein
MDRGMVYKEIKPPTASKRRSLPERMTPGRARSWYWAFKAIPPRSFCYAWEIDEQVTALAERSLECAHEAIRASIKGSPTR